MNQKQQLYLNCTKRKQIEVLQQKRRAPKPRAVQFEPFRLHQKESKDTQNCVTLAEDEMPVVIGAKVRNGYLCRNARHRRPSQKLK